MYPASKSGLWRSSGRPMSPADQTEIPIKKPALSEGTERAGKGVGQVLSGLPQT